MMDEIVKLVVVIFSVVYVLGIIPVDLYGHFMEGRIESAVLSLVFLAIVGSIIAVFMGLIGEVFEFWD